MEINLIKITLKWLIIWCLGGTMIGFFFRWIGAIGDQQLDLMLTFLVPVSGLMFVGVTIATIFIKR